MFKANFTMLQTQNTFVIHIEEYIKSFRLTQKRLAFKVLNIVIIEIFKFHKKIIICMMAQTLITHRFNSFIGKKY